MRRISILGATGSVGQSTLDLIRRERDACQVVALSGGHNIAQLAADAREFNAEIAVTAHEACLEQLREALAGSDVLAAAGSGALLEAASRPADWIMSAIVGAAGLAPGLTALEQGTTLALANKESLVAAGPLMRSTARKSGATIVPVDSEHSAVFQVLIGEQASAVERVIITASGGPFRRWSREQMAAVTVEQAACHPNWDMGKRITIDSASLFNKALELVETKEFFGFQPDQIEVLVHPESLVHALVGFVDGGMMAHLGATDMRHAIGFALHWPVRSELPVQRLDLAKIGQLRFEAPDEARFPALRLGREVMTTGGNAGAVFIAAKDAALDAFISGRIGFLDMAGVVEDVLTQMATQPGHNDAAITLDTVEQLDHLSRVKAEELISGMHMRAVNWN